MALVRLTVKLARLRTFFQCLDSSTRFLVLVHPITRPDLSHEIDISSMRRLQTLERGRVISPLLCCTIHKSAKKAEQLQPTVYTVNPATKRKFREIVYASTAFFFFCSTFRRSALLMCGKTPPNAIVARMRVSSSSSPRMASCRWRGVIRFTFKSLAAF